MFKTNMDADTYNQIMHEFLFPFIADKYDFNIVLHQDNDPKHTSRKCKSIVINNH